MVLMHCPIGLDFAEGEHEGFLDADDLITVCYGLLDAGRVPTAIWCGSVLGISGEEVP